MAAATGDGSMASSLMIISRSLPPPRCCSHFPLRSVRNDAVEVIGEYMRLFVVGQSAQRGSRSRSHSTSPSRSRAAVALLSAHPLVLSSLSLPVLWLCRGRSSLRGRLGGQHDHATRSAATNPRAHERLLTRRHRAAGLSDCTRLRDRASEFTAFPSLAASFTLIAVQLTLCD